MARDINIYFMSITGNTKSLVTSLSDLLDCRYSINTNLYEVNESTLPTRINDYYFVIVPTYLEGGNGIDNGDQEILTEPLNDLIDFDNNKSRLLGVVGSGNRNFATQFCLTAKQYADKFNSSVIYETELRGSQNDLDEIAMRMVHKINEVSNND